MTAARIMKTCITLFLSTLLHRHIATADNSNIFANNNNNGTTRRFDVDVVSRLNPLPLSQNEEYIRISQINNNNDNNTGNGVFSGPAIHVVTGDTLHVHLTNSLPTAGLSLHWHGFELWNAPIYDGVVGVTQCSVAPEGGTFLYGFQVEETPGTYWYHTHSGLSREGYNAVRGPLIVHPLGSEKLVDELNLSFPSPVPPPESDEPHDDSIIVTTPFSYQNERILFFSDGFRNSETDDMWSAEGGLNAPISKNDDGFSIGTHPWEFGTCNGKFDEEMSVWTGETYKFRIINGGHVFALRVSVHGLRMTVVAADSDTAGGESGVVVDDLIVHTAERFDVILDIPEDNAAGTYWIRAETLESRSRGYKNGIKVKLNVRDLVSEEYKEMHDGEVDEANLRRKWDKDEKDRFENYESDVLSKVTINCYSRYERALGGGSSCLPITALSLYSLAPTPVNELLAVVVETASTYEMHTVDFSFQPPPQYSHFTRIDGGLNIQHVNPRTSMFLPDFDWETDLHPHTAVMNVEVYSTAVIVWRTDSSMDHSIHMHGFKMEILKVLIPDRRRDCTIVKCRLNTTVLDSNVIDEIIATTPSRNTVKKDTFIIPAGGTVVTRITNTGAPAVWFAHCHMDTHREDGMAFVMRVGSGGGGAAAVAGNSNETLPPPLVKHLPADYPSCTAPHTLTKAVRPSCTCYDNRDAVLELRLTEDHRCSRPHLCRHIFDEKENTTTTYEYEGGIASHGGYDRVWLVPVVALVTVMTLTVLTIFLHRRLRQEQLKQHRTSNPKNTVASILRAEWTKYRPESVNPLRVVEVSGLAFLTGLVFHAVGDDTTNRGLRESVSLLFFSTTLWTFTRMYPAVSSYYNWRRALVRSVEGTANGGIARGTVEIRCYCRAAVVTLAEGLWPFLYVIVCFPMAKIGFSLSGFFTVGGLLSLNALCYISLGAVLGTICPSVPLGMITCTVVSQMSLICAGFYTTLPWYLEVVRFMSPVYHTFSGMLKVSYKWSDTFDCLIGDSDVGKTNQCFLERSGSIEDLKMRGINVATFGDVKSETVLPEIVFLVSFYVLAQLVIYLLVRIVLVMGGKRRWHSVLYNKIIGERGCADEDDEEELDFELDSDKEENEKDNDDLDEDEDKEINEFGKRSKAVQFADGDDEHDNDEIVVRNSLLRRIS